MKILKAVVIITLLAVLGYGLFQGVTQTNIAKIKEIQFSGASPQTEKRLRSLLTLQIGDPIWAESVKSQAQILNQDPWVENVHLQRVLPNTVIVRVTEKEPVAVVGNKKGDFKYVDAKNTVIDKVNTEKNFGSYPVLWGAEFEKDPLVREKALNIVMSLPDDGPLSRKDLSDIEFDEEHGFQMRLSKTGMVVELGKDNIPLHIDRSRRVVQYLDQHRINAARIDSDYVKKVLVKVRKGR